MRIVFMGTPDFAVNALEALIKAEYDICLVVTQPDRVKGRGRKSVPSPVKECALKHGLKLYQPEKLRAYGAIDPIREVSADLIVVAAFGQILPKEVLDLPGFGSINIHASLLPKYRGAAPIQRAILDGEEKTGVTIMQMDEGLDTGDILLQREVSIDKKETGGSLFEKLSTAGSELLIEALPLIEKGSIIPKKQDDALSTYAKPLKKDMGKIDFEKSAVELERLIRALNPWPSAFTSFRGKTLKIWEAETSDNVAGAAEPGSVIAISEDCLRVASGEGSLDIRELQLEGKRRMSFKDFQLGNRVLVGEKLI